MTFSKQHAPKFNDQGITMLNYLHIVKSMQDVLLCSVLNGLWIKAGDSSELDKTNDEVIMIFSLPVGGKHAILS